MAAHARGQKAPRGLRRPGRPQCHVAHIQVGARAASPKFTDWKPGGVAEAHQPYRCRRGGSRRPRRRGCPARGQQALQWPERATRSAAPPRIGSLCPRRAHPRAHGVRVGRGPWQGGKQSGNSSAAASPAMMRRGTSPAMGRSRKDLAADVDDHGACVPTRLAPPATRQYGHAHTELPVRTRR